MLQSRVSLQNLAASEEVASIISKERKETFWTIKCSGLQFINWLNFHILLFHGLQDLKVTQ
jgi:hypothetical protein